MKIFLLFAVLSNFLISDFALSKESAVKAMPFLGPGSDVMTPDEYQKAYRDYIQQTIYYGYPFFEGMAQPCDQAMSAIFRQAGMYTYPVPQDAQHVERIMKKVSPSKMEIYQLGGVLIQVLRDEKSDALDRLVFINTRSVKAGKQILFLAKNAPLDLDRDARTGLEKIKNVPVGYPHPYLDPEGQGVFVRELRFNKSKLSCAPLEYKDNSWNAGFKLNESRCADTQKEVQMVWDKAISPHELAENERKRMKDEAVKSAMQKGVSRADAEAKANKYITEPFASDINIVGGVMRNLAQCNLLSMGGSGAKASSSGEPSGSPTSAPDATDTAAGSAK